MKKLLLFLMVLALHTSYGQYCTTGLYTTACSVDDDIDDFSLGSFSHLGTGCGGTVGYNDFTSMVITITQTIPQALTVSSTYAFGSENLKLFIDYNNDQDFNDPGEEVYASPGTFGGPNDLQDTLIFPSSSPSGTFRMRARLVFANSTFTACASYTYGEVHDYTVVINPNAVGNCPLFSNFLVDSITADAAKVSWTPGTGNTSFFLEYGPTGFTPGTGTKITGTYPGTQPPVIISGLTQLTSYQVYFGEICNSGSDSVVLGAPTSFTTTPLCPAPTGIHVVGTSASSATFGLNSAFASFDVEWGPVGFGQGTGCFATLNATNNHVTISNAAAPSCVTQLAPNTSYNFYVRNNCTSASNGTSPWVGPFTFTTACAPYMAPYSTNFDTDSVNQVPNCWNAILSGASSGGVIETYTFTTPYSPPQHVRMYNGGGAGASDTTLLISPQFSDLPNDGKRVQFFSKASTAGTTLIVGTVSSVTNAGSFSPIDTITLGTAYQLYSVNINSTNGYNLSHEYVAFRHGNQGTFRSIYIDNFTYEAIPACNPPLINTLGATGITASSANAYWGSGSNGSETHIEWGLMGFTPGTNTYNGTDSVAGTLDTFNITGLSAQTSYDFYIRDSCAANGFSPWVGPFTFKTQCLSSSMPFFESLDFWPVACWDSTQGSLDWAKYIGTAGNNYAFADLWNNGSGNFILTSPPIAITQDAQLRFFWSHLYNTFSPDEELLVRIQVVGSSTWDTLVSLKGPTKFNDPTASSTVPGSFVEEELLLDPTLYTGNDVIIEFVGIADFGANLFLNDIYVEPAPLCPKPSSLNANGITDSSVVLSWVGSSSHTSYEVWFGPQGFYQGSQTSTGGTKVIVTGNSLVIDTLTDATCYEFLVRAYCGSTDTTIWIGPFSFCTSCVAFTMPYSQDFNTWPPICWAVDAGTDDWIPYTGGTDGWAEANFWGISTGNMLMNSPVVVVNQDAQVRYTWSHLSSTTYPNDELIVRVSIAGSGIWDTLVDRKAADNNFNDPTAANTAPGAGVEDTWLLDPATYTGQSIRVQFWANTGFGPSLFINNFYVEKVPSCPNPLALNVSGVIDTSATFGWTGDTSHTNYQVWFGPQGFFQTGMGGHKVFTTADSLMVDTLSAATCYEFVVRAICGPGDTTDWRGPVSFCTQCRSFAMPYVQTFDIWPPICWAVDLGTADWLPYTSGIDGWALANFWNISTGNMIMTSPVVEVNQDAQVRYIWSHLASTAYPDDELIVRVSIAGSGVWDTLVDRKSVDGNFNDPSAGNTNPGTGIEDIWTLDPTTYTGQSIMVQFWANTDFGPSAYVNDFSVEKVTTCPKPSALTASSIGATTATIGWTPGTASNTNFEVEYGAGLTLPNLGTGTRVQVTGTSYGLTGLTSATGYCYFIREICSAGDTSSWVGPYCFPTSCTVVQAPYMQDFETFTVGHFNGVELCWNFTSNNPGTTPSGGFSWEVRNSVQTTSTGTGPDGDNTLYPALGGHWIHSDNSGGTANDSTMFMSPIIDISALASPELKYFFHNFAAPTSTYRQPLYVDLYNGTTWFYKVHVIDSVIQTSGTAPWQDTTISLVPYSSTGTIQVRFRSQITRSAGGAGDVAIDDVSIYDGNPGACAAPTGLTVASQGCDTTEITWNSNSGPQSTLLEYGPAGFAPGTGAGTIVAFVNSPYVITGLTAGTGYDVYVADTCGASDTSSVAGPLNFTTASGPLPVASFTATHVGFSLRLDFDATASIGTDGTTTYTWDFGDGNIGAGDTTSHTYASGGSYTITLTVTNACGSDDTTITVADVSLADNPLGRSLSLYPNPASDKVTLSFTVSGFEEAVIRILDMTGKEVMHFTEANHNGRFEGTIDVSALADGVYMLQVADGENQAVRRLIKE